MKCIATETLVGKSISWHVDFIEQELAHYPVNFSQDADRTVSSARAFLGSFFYLDSTPGFVLVGF